MPQPSQNLAAKSFYHGATGAHPELSGGENSSKTALPRPLLSWNNAVELVTNIKVTQHVLPCYLQLY